MSSVRAGNLVDSHKLYVQPQKNAFDCAMAMERSLRKVDEGTVIYPPAHPEDLMLQPDGRTKRHGKRYTSSAFLSVAKAIAPGLSLLIPNIAGITGRPDSRNEKYSSNEAIRIFNAIIDLRYDEDLSMCQLVVNENDDYIEGLLGPKTQYLENFTFFQMIQDMLGETAETEFREGVVAGRQMMLRYSHKDPLVTMPGDEPDTFHYGYHFANSESGDMSVRAAPLIYRPYDGTASLVRFNESGRQFHTGRDFTSKLSALVSTVVTARPKTGKITSLLEELPSQSLELDPEEPGMLKTQMDALALQLRQISKSITTNVARNIIKRAVYIGSYGADPDEDVEYLTHRHSVIRSRTRFDIYNAITREAQRDAITIRERVERTAYNFVTGIGDK